jgi:hypothetical protein
MLCKNFSSEQNKLEFYNSNKYPCPVDFKMAHKVFVLQVGAELG